MPNAPAYLLLVADDLMMPSRVREALHPLGLQLKTAATLDAALAAVVADPPPRAIMVNCTARRYDPAAVITALKMACPLPLLAFAGHVEQEKHQMARDAGADLVAANSSVALHLPALLNRLLHPSAAAPEAGLDEESEGNGG